MGEPFYAIGFKVTDEASYQALAEEAHQRGTLSKARRSQGVLHGCCWSLGAGLEVWTVLYESKEGLFYADCRPAFRSQFLFNFYPWEIVEYEEDGEAVTRGVTIDSDTEMVFELQNLTEINPTEFRERSITAAVSGLAYRAQVYARCGTHAFAPLASRHNRKKVAENDYFVSGTILSWREIKNQHTTSDLIWISVDLERIKLEVLVNRANLKGELKRGGWISAEVWLQGHILNDKELLARYEGLDLEIPRDHYWMKFRRDN
jgi:hypothetical protein